MRIAIVRKTALVSGSDLEAMARAIERQVAEDLAPAWGISPLPVECYEEELAPADAWIVRLVVDAGSDDLGWHAEAGSLPFGVVGVAPILQGGGGALLGAGPDAPSVSRVLSHEILELLVDPDADSWEPGPNGTEYALEVCDPVEASSYLLDGCELSDFVGAPWFDGQDSRTPGGLSLGPLELAPGGYAITRAPDGSPTDVFGSRRPPDWRLGGHRHAWRHARQEAT